MARRTSLKDEWKFDTEISSHNQNISIDLIKLPASQPRTYFDPQKLEQLTESIRQHGIIEPLLVRPSVEEGFYELVAGERRLRAAQVIGLDSVPVTIRELNDEESLQLALIENLQREDLNPVEETEGILQLLALRLNMKSSDVPFLLYKMRNEAIGNSNQNVLITPEAEAVQAIFTELSTIAWESFVTTRLPLLNLPPEVIDALRKGEIAYTKAQAIARIKDANQRQEILQMAIAENWSLTQIKQRIRESGLIAGSSSSKDQESPHLKQRMDNAYRQIKQSKIWSNPKKQRQIEKIITMIESLISDNA
jgi:ParB family chromosome partitioning protein